MIETWNTFKADYKGTCALCWASVNPGDLMVPVDHHKMGVRVTRNVHVECQRRLILSNDPDSADREKAAVHKRTTVQN